jgi:hypothetical protein
VNAFGGMPDPLQQRLAEAQAQEQAQRLTQQTLKAALENPMELRTYGLHLMALRRQEDGQLVLSVALLGGVRFDFLVTQEFVQQVAALRSDSNGG